VGVGTTSFDQDGVFSLSNQSYVSAQHEDLTMPAMAAEGSPNQDGGNGAAIILFTLTGNGGPTGADNGGFFPSTAYGRVSSSSDGLTGAVINIADLGRGRGGGRAGTRLRVGSSPGLYRTGGQGHDIGYGIAAAVSVSVGADGALRRDSDGGDRHAAGAGRDRRGGRRGR
jgi:hypothetical protein